ncbi:hypothetical protein Cgig2_015126 [Carnegiea gigantea]|uniref:Pentatricopeptide repeat-containing protein n=1 Tax=Carnegiea gigantea TaxID=171969 RepID=A0A9Q1QM53_9CARY|nr:hypothetical protein Cgig2_015126 [Carnegiea gigantea]
MNCYCQLNHVRLAFSLLGKLFKIGYSPNCFVFNTLINGLSGADQLEQALTLLDRILKQGFQPDPGPMDEASKLMDAMARNECRPDVVSYSAMISGYYYNILINGLCEASRLKHAADIFYQLLSRGLQRNCILYNARMKGLCKKGLLSEANKLLTKMEGHGLHPEGFFATLKSYKPYNLIDVMTANGFQADAQTTSLVFKWPTTVSLDSQPYTYPNSSGNLDNNEAVMVEANDATMMTFHKRAMRW